MEELISSLKKQEARFCKICIYWTFSDKYKDILDGAM